MLAGSGPAEAHHSVYIREVRASTVDPASAFVELQSYRQGMNDVRGAVVQAYDPTGLTRHDFAIDAVVPSSRSQMRILVGGTGLAASSDFTDPGLGAAISPAGGAVCFPEAAPPDCVAWGNFTGSGLLPFPGAGPLAPAIPDGMSLTRTIARGCALGLDGPDDTDSSLGDFALTAPTPQGNATPTAERDCVPCGREDATIIGSDRAETLRGTPGRDVIAGLAGADTIKGLGGNDVLCGGIGKDRLLGGRGRDQLLGGRGRDTCRGGPGGDRGSSCEVARGI
jgi:hypothetical protein